MEKTMNLKLTQTGNSQNFNEDDKLNGNSINSSYSVKVIEDNIEVGSAFFNFSINYYGNIGKEDYTTAQAALDAKIEAAIKAFDSALKS